jgi:RNA polymerase sigma factor (sigma-70 family)
VDATRDEMPHIPTTSASSWNDLLDAVARGDPRALHKVTALITRDLARSGAFDLRDSWADIIQDVLEELIALAQRGGLRDPAALVRYALIVTRSKTNDWLAKSLRERQLRGELTNDPRAVAEIAAPPLLGTELLIDLCRGLDELPARERQTLVEIYLQGRTYEQAAGALGLSLRQIKRLQLRGLASLRSALGVER